MRRRHVSGFFFFQAEDGIRDLTVTGVQTCALPISDGEPVSLALTGFAGALAADPWLERWPLLLSAVAPAQRDGAWVLVDEAGDALPLRAGSDPWPLLAVSGGAALTVAGEWSAAGLRPLSCWDGERAVWL